MKLPEHVNKLRELIEAAFDKQFAPELNAKDRWADVQSKSRNLFGSFGKLAG